MFPWQKKTGKNNNHKSPSCSHSLQCLQLQTPSETVFGAVFLGLNTFSEGIWSTRDSKPRKIRAEAAPGGAAHRRPGTGFSDRPFCIRSSYMCIYIYIYLYGITVIFPSRYVAKYADLIYMQV